MGSTKTYSAEVEVDLGDWETDELLKELRNRDVSDAHPVEKDTLEEFYVLLVNEQPGEVLVRIKEMIRDELGKFVK